MIHSTPLSAREAKELGLSVNTYFPEDVHDFMRLFRPVKKDCRICGINIRFFTNGLNFRNEP